MTTNHTIFTITQKPRSSSMLIIPIPFSTHHPPSPNLALQQGPTICTCPLPCTQPLACTQSESASMSANSASASSSSRWRLGAGAACTTLATIQLIVLVFDGCHSWAVSLLIHSCHHQVCKEVGVPYMYGCSSRPPAREKTCSTLLIGLMCKVRRNLLKDKKVEREAFT